MNFNFFNRRRFLKLLPLGLGVPGLKVLAQNAGENHDSGISQSPSPNPGFIPDIELELVAMETQSSILPGTPTRLWQYRAKLLKGSQSAVSTLPGGQIPVIRIKNEQRIRVFFKNELPEPTIVHWHGLHIQQKMDGHPMYAIDPGQQFVYEFQVNNRAGTYWFHPHPHGRTGIQVYRGLVGLFIVEDEEEAGAGLPSDEYELAWVLQDRRFNQNNQLVYAMNHMQMMMGYTGDKILVNGLSNHVEEVADTAYRVRVFNGSNSRFYKLAWNDGRPMTVIGSDGGLLEQSVEKPHIMLAPAERLELYLDLSESQMGDSMILQSQAFQGGMMGMGMGMGRGMMGMNRGALPNGAPLDILRVQVTRQVQQDHVLPSTLSAITWPEEKEAVNVNSPRQIRLQMGMGRVALNNRTFEMMDVASDEIVKLNTTEVWEFINDNGHMTHPMHVHNIQFKVIERQRNNRFQQIHNDMSDGLVDEGWKDVVIVMPGERVKVLLKFSHHAGLYLYHCHILEHEDLGMMRNYLIEE
jgi:blue copper oxidase